jgi:hypothetical protein
MVLQMQHQVAQTTGLRRSHSPRRSSAQVNHLLPAAWLHEACDLFAAPSQMNRHTFSARDCLHPIALGEGEAAHTHHRLIALARIALPLPARDHFIAAACTRYLPSISLESTLCHCRHDADTARLQPAGVGRGCRHAAGRCCRDVLDKGSAG